MISAEEVAVAREAAPEGAVTVPPSTVPARPQPVPDVTDPPRERFETFDVDHDGRADWARIYEQVVEIKKEPGWWAVLGQEMSRAMLAAIPGIATALVGSWVSANKARRVLAEQLSAAN